MNKKKQCQGLVLINERQTNIKGLLSNFACKKFRKYLLLEHLRDNIQALKITLNPFHGQAF